MGLGGRTYFYTWISGLLAAPAIAHVIRMLLEFDLVVAQMQVPMLFSALCIAAFGVLSVGAWLLACRCAAERQSEKEKKLQEELAQAQAKVAKDSRSDEEDDLDEWRLDRQS